MNGKDGKYYYQNRSWNKDKCGTTFLHKSIMEGGIPFEVKQPRFNAETEKAIEEARHIIAGDIPAKHYDSVRELFTELDKEITAEWWEHQLASVWNHRHPRPKMYVRVLLFRCTSLYIGKGRVSAMPKLAAAYSYGHPCPFWNVFFVKSITVQLLC